MIAGRWLAVAALAVAPGLSCASGPAREASARGAASGARRAASPPGEARATGEDAAVASEPARASPGSAARDATRGAPGSAAGDATRGAPGSVAGDATRASTGPAAGERLAADGGEGDGARAGEPGGAPGASAAGETSARGEVAERWCAPEFDALSGEVCAFVPAREAAGPRTLIIFLHGVVEPNSGWQWNQQRAAARAAKAHGVAVLMPRAVRGAGPKGMRDYWAWPGGASAEVEADIVATWQTARAELEARDGRPFERVWVFGFSSGAYYATSLALRGRLAGPGPLRVDGFAAFAGGGGASAAIEQAARRARARTPLFVAWGGRDRSHRDPMQLAAMLRRVGWPSKGEASPKAGHAMTDAQAASAVRFLSGGRGAAAGRKAEGAVRR